MILAIDPSLAKTGYAWFKLPDTPPADLQGYAACLLDSGVWKTSAADPIEDRLALLASQCLSYVATRPLVVLEVPARIVAYARHQGAGAGILAGMCHLNRAIGLYEGLSLGLGLTLVRIPASRQTKTARHQRVTQVWPNLGRTTEDQRDALALGLGYLLDQRRRGPVVATDSGVGHQSLGTP